MDSCEMRLVSGLCVAQGSALHEVLAQSRNSLNMSGRNERDKAHFPRRAQDKISPGGMSTQPWLGQVRKVVLSEHRVSAKGKEERRLQTRVV